ncbi:MAG: 3,4-dehydroadipyl-CoA semialdehyde dehydrogenase [Alphaproteobacteria bacterium]
MKLQNHVGGKWVEGKGQGQALVDPSLGTIVAHASADGIDMKAAAEFARKVGGSALRKLTYGERAALLAKAADVLSANRDKYYATAFSNAGNTKIDAAIDVDGGIGTLKYFAGVGAKMGDKRVLKDGVFERMAKDENFTAVHIGVPRNGVAVHINAFNFPGWGLWGKAAVAILSGLPVLAKPATSTALLAYQMVKDVADAGVFPAGVLSLICGSVGDLFDHLTGQDNIAFTGSADTAMKLRAHPSVMHNSIRFNVEADSLNTSLLGPDAKPGTPEFDHFVREVSREITQKAGQKCTAIRRAFVPRESIDAVTEALKARLEKTVVGNPRNETVTMGPLVNKAQQQSVRDGIAMLAKEAKLVTGGEAKPVDGDAANGAFVAPTLFRSDSPGDAKILHELEVFGPCSTVMAYDKPQDAFALSARGGGSLVASVFTGDDAFAGEAMLGLAPSHGRVLVIDDAIAKSSTGHGIVMPMCVHGGPGRAGGGEELGGMRALRFYHQRVAMQGNATRLRALADQAFDLTV